MVFTPVSIHPKLVENVFTPLYIKMQKILIRIFSLEITFSMFWYVVKFHTPIVIYSTIIGLTYTECTVFQ